MLVAGATIEGHLQNIRQLFMKLQEYDVTIKMEKCELGKESFQFLGHTIDSQGITPLPTTVADIRDYPLPKSQRKLR